jgi:hypothetical protein
MGNIFRVSGIAIMVVVVAVAAGCGSSSTTTSATQDPPATSIAATSTMAVPNGTVFPSQQRCERAGLLLALDKADVVAPGQIANGSITILNARCAAGFAKAEVGYTTANRDTIFAYYLTDGSGWKLINAGSGIDPATLPPALLAALDASAPVTTMAQ